MPTFATLGLKEGGCCTERTLIFQPLRSFWLSTRGPHVLLLGLCEMERHVAKFPHGKPVLTFPTEVW